MWLQKLDRILRGWAAGMLQDLQEPDFRDETLACYEERLRRQSATIERLECQLAEMEDWMASYRATLSADEAAGFMPFMHRHGVELTWDALTRTHRKCRRLP